ncbi:MAG: DUF3325 family protein [Myxococcota bacterium]
MAAAVTLLAGFVVLSLSSAPRARAVFGRALRAWESGALRALGACALVASVTCLIFEHGAGVGLVRWCGLATVCLLLVAPTLTGLSRRQRPKADDAEFERRD